MSNNIMDYNSTKIEQLIEKIKQCNGDYQIYCLDVDDVIFDMEGFMQNTLEKIDHRATRKYRQSVIQTETSEDANSLIAMSYKILNAILEEKKVVIINEKGEKELLDYAKPLIDYEKAYLKENLIPNNINYVNYILENKNPNTFVIYVSHRNPLREGEIKTKVLYELTPKIDGIITLPYHNEQGLVSDKGLWVALMLHLTNENYDYAVDDRCVLIDNDKKNCKNFRNMGGTNKGGLSIEYLPKGFQKNAPLSDHLSKLVSLDPYNLQFALSYIRYARTDPNYPGTIDNPDYFTNCEQQYESKNKILKK